MENLNLLYFKTYYEGISSDGNGKISINDIEKKNSRLTNNADFSFISLGFDCNTIRLYTTYPGLLAGVGYAHGVKNDDDIKCGFSLDYVTGQPYIPGSTVKGVLHSIFSRKEVIAEILSSGSFDITLPEENKDKVITEIENDIFVDDNQNGKDVFLDAVIFKGDNNGKILGFDSITPHNSNNLKNPTPINILKIMPDVGFEFRFILTDTVVTVDDTEYCIKSDKKLELFKEILLNFGIGAKTNVGYGNLHVIGKCTECGKDTKQKADGSYWELCIDCKNKKQNSRQQFSLFDNPKNKKKNGR